MIIFCCCPLPEKFTICPKNNGFARVWGLQPHSPLARRSYAYVLDTFADECIVYPQNTANG